MMPMAKPTRPRAAVAVIFRPVLLALFALFLSGFLRPAAAAEPCCQITGIDTSRGTVTAKESASQRTFQFTVKDRLLLSGLKVGQRIYANFNTKQVSVDGGSFCCAIVSISATAPQPAPRPTTAPSTPSAAPARPAPGGLPSAGQPATGAAPQTITLPKAVVATGPLRRTPPQPNAQWQSRRLSTTVEGKPVDLEVVHLHGIEGIEAADIPESAKAFLLTHANTLPPDEVADYVINKKQIEAWAKAHPLPETLKKKKETHGRRGCRSISMHCAREGVKHVSKEVSKQAEALRKEARGEWKDISREVGRDLKMAEGALLECFADHRLSSGLIPIPSLTISPKRTFTKRLDKKYKNGEVSGSAHISIPVRLDHATIEVTAFVIPCAYAVKAFPIWVRPRSVSLKGVLTLDSAVDLELNANGTVGDTIKVDLPDPANFYTTVIVIGEVPVELDLGIEFDGKVVIEANGVLHATFCDKRQRKVQLDFACDGKGCGGEQKDMRVDKPTQDLQVAAQGVARIKPSVRTMLRLDVNFGALAARVGPEFYVLAEVKGEATAGSSGTRPGGPVATAAGLSANLFAGFDVLYFVDFVRPEFLKEKSGLTKTLQDTLFTGPKDRLWSTSKKVESPSAAAQSIKPGSASERCAK